ncbi:MAK10-like protein [Tanacetum coccineum]|uniref:MAK10-like protein n=1 Tax=Tanacetum coccineum TaxID=301880 RepID=A0ABQ4Y283_9ASTR
MGDENPIRTLGDYSKPSHEGYRNTIELPIGNNVVPLRSDTIWLVQNGCSFHGLRSEDPNQHLKDFLKLVDSLELDGENRERTRLRLFQLSLRDQASNWLERLPAGSITTWEDLTTRFLAQFFPPGRIVKLRNDILMFQQHHGESLSEAWTHVPSTSDRRLIELENQVQRLMEAHLTPTQPTQVNKITTSYEICSGPHDTKYCMEDPEQAFVEYASSRTDEAGSKRYTFKPEQNNLGDTYNPSWRIRPNLSLLRPGMEIKTQQPEEPEPTLKDEFQDFHLNLPVLEVLAHASIYNAILDKYVESLELGKNGSAFVQGEVPAKMEDPGLYTLPCRLGDSKPFDTLADLGSCVNIIPLYLFKKLNIRLLEETNHIFGLADGIKSYPVGIVKDVEVHIGKLKLLNDFYVIDMKKDPETPLLVGRGFLATANAVIDCRMAKIAVGEVITRSVFRVKGVDLGEEEAPYWTTLGKRESCKPRPHSDGVRPQTPYYARKDFLDCHLPGEWEIARDTELNPFKDVLVFRRMVEFLGAILINLKSNMWESKDLIKNPIN